MASCGRHLLPRPNPLVLNRETRPHKSPEAKRGAGLSWRCKVARATTALALLGLSAAPAAAQVLRNPPPTPYHFLAAHLLLHFAVGVTGPLVLGRDSHQGGGLFLAKADG